MNKGRGAGTLLLLGFTGLICLYFREVLTQSKLMVERDLPIFFFPNLKLWVEAVKAGELPLWNPYSFSGQPLFASLQTSIFYPPNLLLLFLPLSLAFNLTIVIHFILSGWFIYLLARELGGSRTAAILATLSSTLGGFLLSIHNVLNTLQTVTWTPLVFFFFLRALRERSWKYPILSAITILVQFLGAGIEAFLLTQIVIFFLAFCPQALLPGRSYAPIRRRLQMAGWIFLLFLGLGAVQILPFGEMTRASVRHLGFNYQEATRWSLAWRDLLYLFLPDFFWRGVEFYKTDQNYLKSIYLGILPFMMVLFFFWGRDRRKGWAGLLLVFSLLLAMGGNTPFYQFLYFIIPGLHTIRYPVKFYFLTNLVICLLTGLGWDALSDRLKEDPGKKLLTLKKVSLVLAFLLVMLLLIISFFRGPFLTFLEQSFPISYDRPWGFNFHNIERFSFFALLTFLFFIFLADRQISPRKGQVIIIILLVLDLFLANWGFYRRMDQKAYYSLSPNLEAVLTDPEKGHLYTDPLMRKIGVAQKMEMEAMVQAILKEGFYYDYPLVHRIYNTSGFGILTYQPYQDLLNILSQQASNPRANNILGMMNVKFILWHEALDHPGWALIRKGESYVILEESPKKTLFRPPDYKTIVAHLYENKEVLPRAFLVSTYQVVRDRKERLARLQEKGFDPAQTVLLEEAPDPPRPSNNPLPNEDSVRIVKFGLNQMELLASCTEPRLLFLSETFYPGWKVWVDGQREKIYRANHAFRAVALGPGRHAITFKYEPNSFYFGLAISGLTLLSLIVGLICFRGRSDNKNNPEV